MTHTQAIAVANMAKQLTINGQVPVHHESGVVQRWTLVQDTRGIKSMPDNDNLLHDLLIPSEFISVRHNTVNDLDHVVFNPHFMRPDRKDLIDNPICWEVIRINNASMRVTLDIPEPAPAALEITLSNGAMVTIPQGEKSITRVVNNMANHMYIADNPVGINSLNAVVLYDIQNVKVSAVVESNGYLVAGQKHVYNHIK